MPFVPHFLLRDMVGWYLALGILAALAALFPWELGQKADPFGSAPADIKPEWYFLFMFQSLKDLPAYLPSEKHPWIEGETLGILFFGFLGLMVALVPFLDRGAASRPSAASAEFLCRRDGGVRYFHDRAEHDGKAPAESTRQGPRKPLPPAPREPL